MENKFLLFVGGLFLVVLFGFAQGTPTTYVVTDNEDTPMLVGREKCTYGPSYWCKNITQASSCSAVKHCVDRYWTNLKLEPDNDDVCKICKDMVQQARDQLLSNETQDELRQVLEGSCALIPLKIVSNECKELADNFIPELVDALASRMDPQQVCAISGLCNSARIDEMLANGGGNKNKKVCQKCRDFIHNLDKDKMKMILMEYCGYLGSYSDSCRAVVTEEFDNIDFGEICDLVGICTEGENAIIVGDGDLPCDFCKDLVTHIKEWLTANTTQEEFNTVVQNICKQAGKYKEECQSFFKNYESEIFQLINDDLDPSDFCERLGVCINNSTMLLREVAKKPQPIWTILPTEDGNYEMKKLLPAQEIVKSTQCTLCNLVTAELEEYLEDPSTEQTIEKFFDRVCEKLPKNFKDECEAFVQDYGQQFIELVGQELDPKEICPRLHLCPAISPPSVESVKDVLPTCAICEFTVTKLINMIGSNHTKESIEEATEKVCHMIPAKYLKKCENFMENYGDRVIEMILVDGTAHEICAAVHLCLFKDLQAMGVISGGNHGGDEDEELKEDPKCVLCEYVITTLADRVKDNATEAEIKAEVLSICDHLPKTVRKNCRAFVTIYGDEVIQYLISEMNPSEICTELHLCKPTPARLVSVQLQKNNNNEFVGVDERRELKLTRCELCSVISDYLKLKRASEDKLSLAREKFCPILRNKKSQCLEMVEDYGEYILQILTTGESENVCQDLDIC